MEGGGGGGDGADGSGGPSDNAPPSSPAIRRTGNEKGAGGGPSIDPTFASQFFPGDECGAAIAVGFDLTPGGDAEANGFSAGGWDRDAASEALRRAEGTLRRTGNFVEEWMLKRKEGRQIDGEG